MWSVIRPLFVRSNYCTGLNPQQLKLFEGQCRARMFKTRTNNPNQGISKAKIALLATVAGVSGGAVYTFYNSNQQQLALLNPIKENSATILESLPNVRISKQIRYPADSSGLKVILFQFATCPFCCKVRAFLDYYGISYDLVEVDSVLKKQLKWTDYKKVPIILVKVADKYIQLNDSSAIISVLTSHLNDREVTIEDVSGYYPRMLYRDDNGAVKEEILNRYYLMFQKSVSSESKNEYLAEERKWRKWADDVLVHMLSPNVYRNSEEALQAFRWFSEVGEWDKNFNPLEVQFIIYVGATAMRMISKRLKKRHHLKDDVRLSLYEETNKWLKELRKKETSFHGGASPDLADLAVYGVLNSIEGCVAFKDLLLNTQLNRWYSEMKAQVGSQSGTPLLVHR